MPNCRGIGICGGGLEYAEGVGICGGGLEYGEGGWNMRRGDWNMRRGLETEEITFFFIRTTLYEHEVEFWWKIKNKAEPEALSLNGFFANEWTFGLSTSKLTSKVVFLLT